MKVLLVLMWKHKVVRVRRFILTILEFVVPMLLFFLLLAMRTPRKSNHSMHEETKSGQLNEVPNKEIIALADFMPAPHWIMYYPETGLTKMLMDEVGVKLNLKRITTKPAHSDRGYFTYWNESGLPDLAAEMRIMDAIVIFQDMSGETWPQRLNYTIRMKSDFGTESNKSLDDSLGPHRMYGLKYGTFMRIQWAVDTSYIKLLTGNEVSQVVSLQEFHRDDDVVRRSNVELVAVFLTLLPFLCWYSLLLNFTFQASRLLQERISGIQELLRMVGVPRTTLRLSHILNVWPVGLVWTIVATLCLMVGEKSLIQYSSWILIVMLMFLQFNFVISMAFLISYVFGESIYSGGVSVLVYILVELPASTIITLMEDSSLSDLTVLVSGFLPNMPMYSFWKEIASHELRSQGADFSNIARAHTNQSASILMCYIFLLLQISFCYSMTWYLSLVRPGKFGQAERWNFFLKAEYWRKKQVTPANVAFEVKDPRYFEPAPPNSIPGIKIVHVSKMYPKHQALKNVSLDVYKGDITVLLGHNGAGKTTIMNIITGMTSATHGRVYVMGKDTVTQRQEVRKHLGLCPQHNVFFGDLTVREHIMFYTLLREIERKGLSRKTIAEAGISTKQLAERLGLAVKLSSMASQLSGGMQRRLQLGCALAGGADVLVLDEPTSGLDVETRRVLWDLLLSLRGDRTVLLSTHYMEEADALADRVAAIKDGELKCFATTMHIKKAVGTGYRLSFVTTGTPQEEAITRVVTSHVPNASLRERTIYSLVYNVPVTDTDKFPELFAALEAQRSELEIESMAIGVATLEEVFMKLCSDIDTTLTEDEVDTTLVEPGVYDDTPTDTTPTD